MEFIYLCCLCITVRTLKLNVGCKVNGSALWLSVCHYRRRISVPTWGDNKDSCYLVHIIRLKSFQPYLIPCIYDAHRPPTSVLFSIHCILYISITSANASGSATACCSISLPSQLKWRSMAAKHSISAAFCTNVMAVPFRPKRPVRPIRCRYVS